MTIQKETIDVDDTILVVYCDKCGEREPLEATTFEQAIEEVKEAGWHIGKPTTIRYKAGSGSYKETYSEHLCEDCKP